MEIRHDTKWDPTHWSAAHANPPLSRYMQGVTRVWGSDLIVYTANTDAAKRAATADPSALVDLAQDPTSGDGSLASDWVKSILTSEDIASAVTAGDNSPVSSNAVATALLPGNFVQPVAAQITAVGGYYQSTTLPNGNTALTDVGIFVPGTRYTVAIDTTGVGTLTVAAAYDPAGNFVQPAATSYLIVLVTMPDGSLRLENVIA